MKPIIAGFIMAAVFCSSDGSQAQVMRPVLDFRTADVIRNHCLASAEEAGYAVAVAVFDHGGDLVSFAKNGASPAASAVAQWKGRSAAIYLTPTVETAAWNVPTAPMISTSEGGVPLFTKDGIGIGGVGVSGAPSAFDAECGKLAAEAAGLTVSPAD